MVDYWLFKIDMHKLWGYVTTHWIKLKQISLCNNKQICLILFSLGNYRNRAIQKYESVLTILYDDLWCETKVGNECKDKTGRVKHKIEPGKLNCQFITCFCYIGKFQNRCGYVVSDFGNVLRTLR